MTNLLQIWFKLLSHLQFTTPHLLIVIVKLNKLLIYIHINMDRPNASHIPVLNCDYIKKIENF